MLQYQPDASVAERAGRQEEEARQIEAKLANLSEDELNAILRDSTQAEGERFAALGRLFVPLHQQAIEVRHKLYQLLYDLIDDPELSIARVAIGHCPREYNSCLAKLRQLLNASDLDRSALAADSLANIRDDQMASVLHGWLHDADRGRRSAAIQALASMETQEARQALADEYEQGGRSEEDKLWLAMKLLEMGDSRASDFLESVAMRAQGNSSVNAATSMYHHAPADGLRLYRHILNDGDNATQHSLVLSISELQHFPHAYTAAGRDEALAWIDAELAQVS